MYSVFEVLFLGTSGSAAFNNKARLRYGTNTPCVAIRAGCATVLFDAGTGICAFNRIKEHKNEKFHLFFSHYHTDHLEGLLFWNALFDREQIINVYGRQTELGGVSETLTQYLKQPFYPVGMDVFRAGWNFHDISPGDEIPLGEGICVSAVNLSHPGGCLGYKVSYGGKSVCYLTDVELNNHENDDKLYEFIKDTNLLILDSFFKDGELIKGWGHSTSIECASLAKRANAKKLALFHYNFSFSDGEIDALLQSAKEVFMDTLASADGLSITI